MFFCTESCFLYWKLFVLNSWKMFKKLPITKSDFSNVVGATLPQSLSVVNIFLRILQEFWNNFLKEHLQRPLLTPFHCIVVKGCELKSSFQLFLNSKEKDSAVFNSCFRFYFYFSFHYSFLLFTWRFLSSKRYSIKVKEEGHF